MLTKSINNAENRHNETNGRFVSYQLCETAKHQGLAGCRMWGGEKSTKKKEKTDVWPEKMQKQIKRRKILSLKTPKTSNIFSWAGLASAGGAGMGRARNKTLPKRLTTVKIANKIIVSRSKEKKIAANKLPKIAFPW